MSAPADVVLDLEYGGHGRGSYQQIQVQGSMAWDDATASQYYHLNTSEHVWADDFGANYITHCIQIYAGIADGWTAFNVGDIEGAPDSPGWPGPMGAARAMLLEDLFIEWVDPSTGGVYGGAGEDERATALQLLTWEITHESFGEVSAEVMADRIDFDLGAIKWASDDGGVQEIVTDMIALLRDDMWYSTDDIVGLTSDSSQDQALYVPAPGVLAAMGIGLAGLTRRRRC